MTGPYCGSHIGGFFGSGTSPNGLTGHYCTLLGHYCRQNGPLCCGSG